MTSDPDLNVQEYSDALTPMSDEELFAEMQKLEAESEEISPADRDDSDVFARIAMVETEIERRFPGQFMTPYKNWQQRQA